jgi:cysteine desulfurase
VIVSSVEHPSVLGPAERLRELDFDVRLLRVTREGVVDVEHLHQVLTDDTSLVSVMLGNNETGVLQPVAEIAAVCGDRGVPVHTDAVQAVGKIPVDFRALGVAALTVTPHKFHGPLGIGALLLRESTGLEPTLFGGFQQAGVRPGTECVTLCEGFAEALRLAYVELPGRTEQLTRLRDRFERVLSAEFPELVINGAGTPRLPHTSNLSLPGCDRQALLIALDAAGVACSTGSACASGSSQPSPVLIAMGLPTNVVESSLRFSLGADTTDGDMAQAIQRISRVFRELRKL